LKIIFRNALLEKLLLLGGCIAVIWIGITELVEGIAACSKLSEEKKKAQQEGRYPR